MRPPVALLVALAVFAAACGGAEPAETTVDPRVEAAADFAFSARRAIEGTRFDGLGDGEVASLVIELCDDLSTSSDPDAEVMAFIEGVAAPPGEEIDDQIMGIVLAEGAIAVCPDAVDAASLRCGHGRPLRPKSAT